MSSVTAKLAGKVAVVTASTDGIGFAIARRLAQDGAKVMLSSRKQDNVDRAVQELKSEKLNVEGIVCHVSKKEDRQRLFKETINKFGGIDILVSNAAVSTYFGPTLKTPEDAFDKMFDVNVKSSFLLCQDVVPEMEKRGAGSLVIVSSIGGYVPFDSAFPAIPCWIPCGLLINLNMAAVAITEKGGTIVLVTSIGGFVPSALIGVYSITKTALLGMVKALAPELAAKNIRINGLAPGIIETKFSSALTSNETAKKAVLERIPLGRIGVPQDCVGAVSFLVSDDAAWLTGETIVVAGGSSSRL